MRNSEEIVASVRSLADPIIRALDLSLVEVECFGEGARTLLRVFIDKPGGVSVDDCEQVHVSLGHALWLGITGSTDARGIYWTADLVLVAALLLPFALRWRVIPIPYRVYTLATLLVVLSYPLPARPLLSVPRFLIVLFPLVWSLADLVDDRRRFSIALVASMAGYAVLAAAFMDWGFIF